MDNREAIIKTIDKIAQLSKQPGNKWLLEEFFKRFGLEETGGNTKLDEIYEYCIGKVIREQATRFYEYFPITEITSQLVDDFCRMERYRRQNNFGDFCLAVFQQVESITNWLCQRQKFIDLYKSKKNDENGFKDKDGMPFKDIHGNAIETIGQLIIQSDYQNRKSLDLNSDKVFFNERIRAVLYFVYFNEKTTKIVFEGKYGELNSLYQCRNLNHRGAGQNPYQKSITDSILPHKYNYYLKFTGLLVDYVERISQFMSKQEEKGIVSSKLPGQLYIKPENGDVFVIDSGKNVKLWYKVKLLEKGDGVMIERDGVTKEITSQYLVIF